MFDLIEELLERMERNEKQIEKCHSSRDASTYMGHVESLNETIRTVLADKYTKRADRIYFDARKAYEKTLDHDYRENEKMWEILKNQQHATQIIEKMDRELRRRMTPEFVEDLERTVMQRVQEKEKHDV